MDPAGDVRKRKQAQLLRHLQGLLQNGNNKRESVETLEYFLRRLGSQQTNQRLRALKGLRMVLSSADDADEDEPMVVEVDGTKIDTSNEWLLQKLPGLPCFTEFYPQLSHQVWPTIILHWWSSLAGFIDGTHRSLNPTLTLFD